MSVKSIFKTLIGTIVLIIVASLIVEIFNISTTSLQINQISKIAGRQASELFSQETYKTNTKNGELSGTINMSNINNSSGGLYVSGKFYNAESSRAIYNSLYTSNEFKQWLSTNEAARKGNWYNLNLLNRALNNPDSLNIGYGASGYDEAMTAKLYKEVMMTPLNLGIPYLDKETLSKMFRWNVAQLFSNYNSDTIRKDDSGNYYIAFKGFKIYASKATILSLDYQTFDLSKSKEKKEFKSITNIDPDNLGFLYDKNLSSAIKRYDDERMRVAIVGINYRIPVSYEGITPIKNIFNFVWNNEVDGLNSSTNRDAYQQWSDSLDNLDSGGISGNTTTSGVLPIPGKLIYYVIR